MRAWSCDRHAHLLEDEVALEIIARRGQGLCPSRDDHHVGAQDTSPLQELVHGNADALIEAGEHHRIGDIRIRRGVPMKGFFHASTSLPCVRTSENARSPPEPCHPERSEKPICITKLDRRRTRSSPVNCPACRHSALLQYPVRHSFQRDRRHGLFDFSVLADRSGFCILEEMV